MSLHLITISPILSLTHLESLVLEGGQEILIITSVNISVFVTNHQIFLSLFL
jgi:hypothetical protein